MLVATKDFVIGDIVLEEIPLLVFANEKAFTGLLRAFMAATVEVKDKILEMYHTPLTTETKRCLELRNLAQIFAKVTEFALPAGTINKLMLIADTNCHAYRGKVAYYETIVNAGQSEDCLTSLSALFLVASKAAHSCYPNVMYTTKTGPFMRYRAVRPITRGEQVTYSYIDSLYSEPRQTRRLRLMDTKNFHCCCERCRSVDDTRGFRCLRPSCQGVSFRTDDDPSVNSALVGGGEVGTHTAAVNSPAAIAAPGGTVLAAHTESDTGGILTGKRGAWVCGVCQVTAADAAHAAHVRAEDDLQAKLTALISRYHELRVLPNGGPDTIQRIVDAATRDLSPTHFLVVKALQFLALWSASQADVVRQMCELHKRSSIPSPFGAGLPPMSPAGCRLDSARALVRAVQVRECVAAGCPLGSCAWTHAPVLDCQQDAFYAMQDYLPAGAVDVDPMVRLATHYLPLFRLNYGADDEDVLRFERLVAHPAEFALPAPQLADADAAQPGPGARGLAGSGKKNKKGGGGAPLLPPPPPSAADVERSDAAAAALLLELDLEESTAAKGKGKGAGGKSKKK